MIGFYSMVKRGQAREQYQPTSVHASLFSKSEKFGLYGTESVDAFPFDLLLNESHALEFSLGDHAIENGASITDHVNRKLRSCTIKGYFTNHPVKDNLVGRKKIEYDNRKMDQGEKAMSNRALEMLEQLETISERKQPVRLVTALKVYPEMLIQSLSYSRNPDDGSAVTFTMRLREFRLATVRVKTYTVNLNTEAGRVAATPEQQGLNSAQERSVSILSDGQNPFINP